MNIELNVERTLAGNVASGANVIFDNIITQEGQISYNPATGVITFNRTGSYIVNWSVVTETTLSDVGVGFALSSSAGDFIQGDSILKTGEVTGFGIINVDAFGETLSLVNSTADNIIYSSIVPIKASLMLFQETISVTGPTGATGVTGAGVTTLYLATDQSVSDRGWLGLGTSSSEPAFTSSTVVIPTNATIAGMSLNIRNNTIPADDSVTATIFTSPCGFANPVSTGISVTINGPSNSGTPNCAGSALGTAAVTAGTLLSVQLTTSAGVGALSQGVSVSIFFSL